MVASTSAKPLKVSLPSLFPPFHEKGGREDLGRRELVQPQEELHVGVLPDDAHGLVVTQGKFVLDDQAADHDAGVDGHPAALRENAGSISWRTRPMENGRPTVSIGCPDQVSFGKDCRIPQF